MSKGSKSNNRGFPNWYKGRLVRDDIGGFWWGEREGKIFQQRGLNVSKKNFDFITEEQRQDMIKRRKR